MIRNPRGTLVVFLDSRLVGTLITLWQYLIYYNSNTPNADVHGSDAGQEARFTKETTCRHAEEVLLLLMVHAALQPKRRLYMGLGFRDVCKTIP